jgi:ribosomal protein S18 acetylase RimI-like enzyme
MEVIRLPWDSMFFNMEVGRLPIDGDYARIDREPFDLIYANSGHDFRLDAPAHECSFTETKYTFSKRLAVENNDDSANLVRASEIDFRIDALYDLAYESGKFSRFKLDPKFGIGNFQKLYRAWIDNSLNGNFADDVILYIENGKMLGFITYKIYGRYAQCGIVAVRPDAQGKGIGQKLFGYVENRLFADGIGEMRVPTQKENEAACRFYMKLGYSVMEISFIKHYWKI